MLNLLRIVSFRCLYGAAVWLALMMGARAEVPAQNPATTAELQQAHQRLLETFTRHLAQMPLAIARSAWPPQPASGSILFVPTDQYTVGGSDPQSSYELKQLQQQFADALFSLAKQAAEVGELSLAFQWATDTLRNNPDHAEAHRVLGYEPRDGKWLTAYGVQMFDAKESRVWHPQFGWISVGDAPRYEQGERLVNGRWVSTEEDAARHTSIASGWVLRTDHFLVRTNVSLEAAAELAGRLERLHQIWRQLFAGFYMTDREVRDLFAGKRPPRMLTQPMRVYYYRNKDEYAAALVKRQPRIAETLGIYFDADKESHFYAGADDNAGTLNHEAVHQMFQETRPATRRLGAIANFWVVEGVATYFETLREHAGNAGGRYYTIGEADAGRLPAARERLLKDGCYVPLAELVALGKDDLQRRADLAPLYSECAGLATFLMDADDRRYREALVRYLNDVYAGRDNAGSLAKQAGESYAELDAAYRQYMESLP